ncbi:MAG: TIGR03905 family TSCPD domain-containing protein [Oscillospiraceae bacterium]|nr:TIGR03905 family TSCPD domain-containing protein [Oscillospiraceae bacterium]
MHYDYRTKGTCSQIISLDIDGDVVSNVKFFGGCPGNLKGIPALVEGMTVDQIESRLKGITCGHRPTSCPDQLAIAVREAYKAQQAQ